LPGSLKAELGNEPQEAQTPQARLDIFLHGQLHLSIFTLIAYGWVKTFYRHQKTASGSLLLLATLFEVGGVSSFRVSGHNPAHQEPRHPFFVQCGHEHPYLPTVVAVWRFPVVPWTPHVGGQNEAAGLFATKTPAFPTQVVHAKGLKYF
jgi:hypothetical protein